jgi:hypothetical protein
MTDTLHLREGLSAHKTVTTYVLTHVPWKGASKLTTIN